MNGQHIDHLYPTPLRLRGNARSSFTSIFGQARELLDVIGTSAGPNRANPKPGFVVNGSDRELGIFIMATGSKMFNALFPPEARSTESEPAKKKVPIETTLFLS